MKQGSRVFTSPQLPEAMQSLQVCPSRCISCISLTAVAQPEAVLGLAPDTIQSVWG